MEYCLIYLSASAKLLNDDEISKILQQSQTNNRSLNITGVLLYCNGSIIQVLEGDQQKVEDLYDVISQDQRHNNLIRLYSGQIEQRSFADWLMGYRTLSSKELSHLHELMPFIKDPLSPKTNSDGIVMAVLKTFYKNNYRN